MLIHISIAFQETSSRSQALYSLFTRFSQKGQHKRQYKRQYKASIKSLRLINIPSCYGSQYIFLCYL